MQSTGLKPSAALAKLGSALPPALCCPLCGLLMLLAPFLLQAAAQARPRLGSLNHPSTSSDAMVEDEQTLSEEKVQTATKDRKESPTSLITREMLLKLWGPTSPHKEWLPSGTQPIISAGGAVGRGSPSPL